MENTPNYAKLRNCINCDFKCYKNIDWERHINTTKHKNRTNLNILEQNTPIYAKCLFTCKKCNKEYKARNSLWYHEKKCNYEEKIKNENNDFNNDITDKDQLILMLINQNAELIKETTEFKNIILEHQTMMMKVIENGTHNTTNNTTNSHNKSFNLQFFLNETCKDAMNIMDFVDSIKLQLSDLENVGKVGYIEGISNIITSNLKALDVTKRPVHCADKKREVMYVKDDDKWQKDENNNNKIRKAIKRVASKNQKLIPEFKKAHPDCNTYHSKFSDQYNKIIVESMGGSGDNDLEKEDKIIRNISKIITIDKEV